MTIETILFFIPNLVIMILLAFCGIYFTLAGIWTAIKLRDYPHLQLIFLLTLLSAMVGWGIGCLLT